MATGYKLRDDFEAWVNNPHKLSRKTEPGYTDEYEHPWTEGAWAAWQECHERAKPAATEPLQITRAQWDDATRGLGTKAQLQFGRRSCGVTLLPAVTHRG